MLEKGKISAVQMSFLLYAIVIGTVIISVPATIGKHAKNDLWLSPIWASLFGMIAVGVSIGLHRMFPRLTLIQSLSRIFGRIPGKLLGLAYLVFYLILNGHGIRLYADFIVGTALPSTPILVLMATMIFVASVAVYGGIEGIGRSSQVIVPLYVLTFLIIVLLLLPDAKPNRLFPMLENGIVPSLKGAVTPQGWFAETLLLSFILPCLSDSKKAMKWGLAAVLAVMTTLVLANLIILLLYGNNVSRYVYPLLSATRYISYAEFFENVEAALVAIWVLGNFIKFSIIQYAVVLGTAQWLELADYRPLVWPIGFVMLLIGFWSLPNQMVLTQYSSTVFPYYSLLFQTILPLFILFVAFLRIRASRGGPTSG